MAGIAVFSLLYAVVRYHLFKGVPWEHFPLFILNKALALTSILLLALSFLVGPFRRLFRLQLAPSGAPFALVSLVLAFQHGLMSLVLLGPDQYPQLFDGAGLSGAGESSLLFGVTSFTGMVVLGVFSLLDRLKVPLPSGKPAVEWLKYGCLCFTGGHVLVMGIQSWPEPGKWPGGLLPVSLISFLAVCLTLLIRGIFRERAPGRAPAVVRRKEVITVLLLLIPADCRPAGSPDPLAVKEAGCRPFTATDPVRRSPV